MTTAITKESLAARIADLEYGPRSLKEDYTLAAYKMLLATMEAEPVCFVSESNLATLTKYRAAVKVKAEPVMVRPVALYRHAQPAPVITSMANKFIAAIEIEQDRLHGEDYLMDSKDCIDVIREEEGRLLRHHA